MELTYRDIVEILNIVDSSGFSHLTIESGNFRLSVSRGGDSVETQPSAGETRVHDEGEALLAATSPEAPESPSESATVSARRVTIGGLERSVIKSPESEAPSATAVPVKAPMLGVFYRAPAPEAPPFVEVGQKVTTADTLCLIESMKMFMPVNPPIDGVVASIAAENGSLVEFNQQIMWIEPDSTT